ncbi:MAG: VOC family protein [Nitrospinota bacterium]|jgi:catechol 2,3-dioxygenase-like lactoylglutathione lyase family enzyme|nr:VOC family protein [Nitrospinota bacterium]MDP7371046.1 VOC family protein [Nitrospinota bacterium]MDP7503325.1 VOC family protein [Nitrospinota bacterium]MDP7662199.1 VOC family protein [Nitrospinota bacterium]
MEFKFDHVHVVCGDAKEMIDFFERVFGAEIISYNDDFKGSPSAALLLGSMRIFVRGLRVDEVPDAVAPGRVQGLDHFGIGVEDVEKAADWLRARGAEFSVEPHSGGMGGRMIAYVRGPENIDIEIVGPYVGFQS